MTAARRLLLLLSLLLALALVLAACGGDDEDGAAGDDDGVTDTDGDDGEDDGEDGSDGEDGGDAAVNRDGEVHIAWTGPTSTLDPHQEPHTGARPYVFQLFDRLTYSDENTELQPMLATDWEFADDGSYLDMSLRDDVTFNDGTPFTAEAVQASIERAKTLEGSTVASSLEVITDVEPLGDHEVRLHLDGPAADLPVILSSPAGAMISPAAIEEGRDLSEDPGGAGSGPFVAEEFEPNDTAVFVRADDDYWDPEANRMARQSQTWISESAPRMAALRAGEMNMIIVKNDQIPEAQALDDSGEFVFTRHDALLHYALFTRNTLSEFGDVRVRRALNHAIDRNELSSTLLNDACQPTWQTWPEGTMGHNPDLADAYPYDPERAQELLAEAGLEDGFTFEAMVNSGLSPQIEIAEALQAMFADIGVTMEISPVSSSEAVQTYAAGDVPAYLHVFTGHPDPAIGVGRFMVEGGQYGDMAEGTDFNVSELHEQGRDQTLSPDERDEVYQELATEVSEGALYVPICFQDTMFLSVPEIKNVDSMSYAWGGIFDPRYLFVADE